MFIQNDAPDTTLPLRLVGARQAARILNWAGGLAGAWLILYPRPYTYACAAGVLVPLAGMGALLRYRPIMLLDTPHGSAFPSVATGLFWPALGLSLRALFDIEPLELGPVFALSLVVGSLVALVLGFAIWPSLQSTSSYTGEAFGIGIALAYGFGASSMINVAFDAAAPTPYRAVVLNKHIASGKHKALYLHLTPWGPRYWTENVRVGRTCYHSVEIGDSVTVRMHPGRLNVPWLTVE